jgi:outer membrane protein OmpA-like peptidoglycan-associated protein
MQQEVVMRSIHKRRRVTLAVLLVAGFGLSAPSAHADDVELKGVITARGKDGTVMVRLDDASTVVVVFNDETKITRTDGLRSMTLSSAALLPGLRVEVEGVYLTANRFAAEKVSFSRADMKVAFFIQGGIDPASKMSRASAAPVGANTRISNLDDYEVVSTMTVYFSSGSASIGTRHRQELERLAENAQYLRAYVIQIEGQASPVEPDALNDSLSRRRADAVAAVLSQNGIPPANVLVPATIGESVPVPSYQTPQGQSENRKAVVTLLQYKAISDSSPVNGGGTTTERVDPARR